MSPRLRSIAVAEGISLADDGLEALIRLSGGDMRRAINMMQSTYLAAPKRPLSASAVYASTGCPSPDDLHRIVEALWGKGFAEAFQHIMEIKTTKGLALVDIVTGIHELVAMIDLPQAVRIFLYERLADLEWRLSSATSEKIQVGALVGIFRLASNMVPDESGEKASSGKDARLRFMCNGGLMSATRVV